MFDTFVVPDLLPAAPELFLAFMALVILLVDLGVKDSRRTLTFVATVLTLVVTPSMLMLFTREHRDPAAPRPRGWIARLLRRSPKATPAE